MLWDKDKHGSSTNVLVLVNSGNFRVRYGFERHPDSGVESYEELNPNDRRVYVGEDIPDELWAANVIDTDDQGHEVTGKVNLGSFKEEASAVQSNVLYGVNFDSGQPTKVTTTPIGDKEAMDVSLPPGGGSLAIDMGDESMVLRETTVDVDNATFVPDKSSTDAEDQQSDSTIGLRQKYGQVHELFADATSPTVKDAKWVYNPSDYLDLSEYNFMGLMVTIDNKDFIQNDPGIRLEIEDSGGNTKYWDFFRKDLKENFAVLVANLASSPSGGSGVSSFNDNKVDKVSIYLEPSTDFYAQYNSTESLGIYVEKFLFGDSGLKVDTEIDEINAEFDLDGIQSEETVEERFSGDGGTTDFDLNNTANRLLVSAVESSGTWDEQDASLTNDGDTVSFGSAPTSGTDNVRVLYTPKYLGGGVGSDKNDLFSSETISDGNVHSSSVVDVSKFRHGELYVEFESLSGNGPSEVKIVLKSGNSSVQGEKYDWTINDIVAGDEICLDVPAELSATHLMVTATNNDGSPTSNYCDLTVKLLIKS